MAGKKGRSGRPKGSTNKATTTTTSPTAPGAKVKAPVKKTPEKPAPQAATEQENEKRTEQLTEKKRGGESNFETAQGSSEEKETTEDLFIGLESDFSAFQKPESEPEPENPEQSENSGGNTQSDAGKQNVGGDGGHFSPDKVLNMGVSMFDNLFFSLSVLAAKSAGKTPEQIAALNLRMSPEERDAIKEGLMNSAPAILQKIATSPHGVLIFALIGTAGDRALKVMT